MSDEAELTQAEASRIASDLLGVPPDPTEELIGRVAAAPEAEPESPGLPAGESVSEPVELTSGADPGPTYEGGISAGEALRIANEVWKASA